MNNQPSAADMGLPAFQIDRHVLMFAIGISLFSAVAFSLASALVQRLSSLVFGIRPTDPWTFAAVSLLMTLVSMAACALPALRAARVDPISTLSSE